MVSLRLEQAERVPLSAGSDGVIRIGGTRVTLDTVAEAFLAGATAEEIVQQYPSLELADIYCVLTYLLRHKREVAAYLDGRAKQQKTIRMENERRFDPHSVRARLLARRT